MKILVQWSKSPPDTKWHEYDSSEWENLPKKNIDDVVDDKEGFVAQLCVQGMRFNFDHIAVIHNDDYIRVIQWNDDSDDFIEEDFEGDDVKFYPVGLYDGRYNTKIQRTRFLTSKQKKRFSQKKPRGTGGDDIFKTWDAFKAPRDSLIRHGHWLSDEDWNKYNSEPVKSWMDWID